jgi:putative membrane protein
MFRMSYDNHFAHAGLRLGFIVFFIVVLVAALVALVFLIRMALNQRAGRPLMAGQRSASAPQAALQILDERFARGEIDEDEYKRRRDALRGRDI